MSTESYANSAPCSEEDGMGDFSTEDCELLRQALGTESASEISLGARQSTESYANSAPCSEEDGMGDFST